jgi:hypothetical protein
LFASTTVLSEATLLFVVDKPVDRLPMPVDAEVDSELTALVTPEMPVLSEDTAVDVEVESDDRPVLSEETPVDSELATVDRDDTPVLRLETAVEAEVLSELTPVESDDTPVLSDDTPVDREDTPVLKELATVDSEDTPVESEEIPVLVDVLNESTARFVAWSCDPLTASVLSAVSRPAATFVICRSAPFAPTLTTLVGFAPANV